MAYATPSTALLVAPRCCVTHGLSFTFAGAVVNDSSVTLLDETSHSSIQKCDILSGLRPPTGEQFAFLPLWYRQDFGLTRHHRPYHRSSLTALGQLRWLIRRRTGHICSRPAPGLKVKSITGASRLSDSVARTGQ